MGLFDMMFTDAIRTHQRNQRARAKAKVPLTATQQLALIRKQERELRARQELNRLQGKGTEQPRQPPRVKPKPPRKRSEEIKPVMHVYVDLSANSRKDQLTLEVHHDVQGARANERQVDIYIGGPDHDGGFAVIELTPDLAKKLGVALLTGTGGHSIAG